MRDTLPEVVKKRQALPQRGEEKKKPLEDRKGTGVKRKKKKSKTLMRTKGGNVKKRSRRSVKKETNF